MLIYPINGPYCTCLSLNVINIAIYPWVPPVLGVGPLERLVDGARRRLQEVAQELKDALRPELQKDH